MPGRPKSITIIAWYLIVVAVISLFKNFSTLNNPLATELMSKSLLSIPLQYAKWYIGLAVSVICGIGMLKGQSWARLLYVLWSMIGFLMGFVTSPLKVAPPIPGVILFTIIVFFLYRPAANQYFGVGLGFLTLEISYVLFGVLCIIGGCVWSCFHPSKQATTEEIVSMIKSRNHFPSQINDYARLEDIKSVPDSLTFVKTMSKETPLEDKANGPVAIPDHSNTIQSKIPPTTTTTGNTYSTPVSDLTPLSSFSVTGNVHGIMSTPHGRVALINDQVYEAGDTVNGAEITRIDLKSITIKVNGQEKTIPVE